MAPLHFHPLGCPQGQHCSPHSSCFPQRKQSKHGVEREWGEKTLSLTVFLTYIWLWVSAVPCSRVTQLPVCLFGDLSTKRFWGSNTPNWDDRAPAFKGSAASSLHVVKLIYSENTDPLQPRGHKKARAALGGSVCHDLAFPEMLGKLSETASDQVADYKTDWLCTDTRYIWRSTSGLVGLVLCTNLSCFFKWSLIQLPPNLQHTKP